MACVLHRSKVCVTPERRLSPEVGASATRRSDCTSAAAPGYSVIEEHQHLGSDGAANGAASEAPAVISRSEIHVEERKQSIEVRSEEDLEMWLMLSSGRGPG